MNILKSLSKYVLGDSSNPEMVQIPSGQLFLLKEGIKKCIFNDAVSTIRRTSSEFQYQLIITRVFEEGEEELEENLDIEDEYVFLIDESIQFEKWYMSDVAVFTWYDPTSINHLSFEFVASPTVTVHMCNMFELTMLQCMFERKYRCSHEGATEEQLNALKAGTPRKPAAPVTKRDPEEPVSSIETPVKIDPKKVIDLTTEEDNSPVSQETIVSCQAQLFLFDLATSTFVLQAELTEAEIFKTDTFSYWLKISNSDGDQILSQPVEARMNGVFSMEHHSFIWCYFDESETVFSFSLKFPDGKLASEFRDAYSRCMYEILNVQNFSKMKVDEQKYIENAYTEDVEMKDYDDESDSEEPEAEEQEDNEFEDEASTPVKNAFSDGEKNSQLNISYKHDRSFVIRGSKIGVFKHDQYNQLEHMATINSAKKKGGVLFSPAKAMLHEEDSAMVLMDKNDPHSLFKMDLEYGKVVEDWKVHDYIGVTDIVPDEKYSQMTPRKTMVGIGHNSVFRIDPRLAGNKLVESEKNQYNVKNAFSCAATTGKGELVVGSSKGDLRLYNKLNIKAKTHLPGLGDPIIGVDVSENGKWVLATTTRYLLLINTETEGEQKNGFNKSMGTKKPIPKRLQLKPEHVAMMNKDVSFTCAKFSTGEAEEKTIITSSGPYVITWNFRRVKQGHLYDYQLRKYEEDVMADNFKYGQNRAIIVALPNDVTMATKLSTPTKALRQSSAYVNSPLRTPAKNLRSRSDIVNSPY